MSERTAPKAKLDRKKAYDRERYQKRKAKLAAEQKKIRDDRIDTEARDARLTCADKDPKRNGKPDVPQYVTRAEYSRMREMAHQTIGHAVKTGRLQLTEGALICVQEADELFAPSDHPAPPSSPGKKPAGDQIPSLRSSQERKEFMIANLRELEFLKAAGKLVDAAAAEAHQETLYRGLRDVLMTLSGRLCDQFAAETDARTIRDTMDDEIRDALESTIAGAKGSTYDIEAA